jgi:hypothetical protein
MNIPRPRLAGPVLVERLEDALQILPGAADAIVLDAHQQALMIATDLGIDAAGARFHGVGVKVEEHLLEPSRIAEHFRRLRILGKAEIPHPLVEMGTRASPGRVYGPERHRFAQAGRRVSGHRHPAGEGFQLLDHAIDTIEDGLVPAVHPLAQQARIALQGAEVVLHLMAEQSRPVIGRRAAAFPRRGGGKTRRGSDGTGCGPKARPKAASQDGDPGCRQAGCHEYQNGEHHRIAPLRRRDSQPGSQGPQGHSRHRMDPAIVPHTLKAIPSTGRFLSPLLGFPLFFPERPPRGFPGRAILPEGLKTADFRPLGRIEVPDPGLGFHFQDGRPG